MVWGDLNPHTFVYPTGYYYFLLCLQVIRFIYGFFANSWTRPTDLFTAHLADPMNLAPLFRIGGAVASILAIFITYLTARKIVGRKYAWIAALILAMSPFASYWSTQIRPESLIILPASLVLYFGVLYYETGNIKHILLSGLFVGIAVGIKYNAVYLCTIVPFSVWAYHRTNRFVSFIIPVKHIAIAAITSLVGFLALTPFSILDWSTFSSLFQYLNDYRQITWAGLGLDASYQLLKNSPWLWWIHVLNGISPGLFWALLIGLLLIIIKWNTKYIIFLGSFVAMLLFLSWFDRSNDYHIIPILPIVCCILAVAARELGLLAGTHWRVIVIVAFIFSLLSVKDQLGRLSEQKFSDTRIESRKWIEENIPDGTRIILDKYYVPHLIHSEEQIRYLIENPGSNIDFSILEIGLPNTTYYWAEHLPIAVNSMEYGSTDDGLVVQPDLFTPADYAEQGFQYIVLSDWTYARFSADTRYENIQKYYETFLNNCDVVYEIENTNGHPGPRITILSLEDGCAQ